MNSVGRACLFLSYSPIVSKRVERSAISSHSRGDRHALDFFSISAVHVISFSGTVRRKIELRHTANYFAGCARAGKN